MDLLAVAACVSSLAFVALVARAHVARRDLARASPLSAYLTQPTRGAMFAAYLCLGLALAAVALDILPGRAGALLDGVGLASGVLLLIAAACLPPIALTSAVRLDADTRAQRVRVLHRLCSRVAFVAIVLAMLAYSMLGLPGDSRARRALRTFAILVAVFAAFAFAVLLQLPPGSRHYGTVQKTLVGLVVLWLWLAAWD